MSMMILISALVCVLVLIPPPTACRTFTFPIPYNAPNMLTKEQFDLHELNIRRRGVITMNIKNFLFPYFTCFTYQTETNCATTDTSYLRIYSADVWTPDFGTKLCNSLGVGNMVQFGNTLESKFALTEVWPTDNNWLVLTWSSDPDTYLLSLLCLEYEENMADCKVKNAFVVASVPISDTIDVNNQTLVNLMSDDLESALGVRFDDNPDYYVTKRENVSECVFPTLGSPL